VLADCLTDRDDLAAARAAARDRLDGARRPRLWFHLPSLPLTAAGKVDRGSVVSRVSGAEGVARRLV
jgi:long-chain acyl-CoA synthetase